MKIINKYLDRYQKYLTNGMSILTIIIFFTFTLMGEIFVRFFDINKTLGWKWSAINTGIIDIPLVVVLIFATMYGILNITKIKTDLFLSASHLFFIALSSFIFNFWELDLRITLMIILFSVIIFGANIFSTFKNRSLS